MDQLGLMFLYLLLQSSPFQVQSWDTMLPNNKKMGKKMVESDNMTKAALPPPLMLAVYFFIL